MASELSGDDAPAPAAAVADESRAAGGLELDRTVQIELQGAVAAEEADAAPSDEDGGFDLNVLWCALATIDSPSGCSSLTP